MQQSSVDPHKAEPPVGIILIGMMLFFFSAIAYGQSTKLQANYVAGSCHSLDGGTEGAWAQSCEALAKVDDVTYKLTCFEGNSFAIFAGKHCKWPLPKEFNWILHTDGKGCAPKEWNDGLIMFGCLGDYIVSNAQDFPDGGKGPSHPYVPKPRDPKNLRVIYDAATCEKWNSEKESFCRIITHNKANLETQIQLYCFSSTDPASQFQHVPCQLPPGGRGDGFDLVLTQKATVGGVSCNKDDSRTNSVDCMDHFKGCAKNPLDNPQGCMLMPNGSGWFVGMYK